MTNAQALMPISAGELLDLHFQPPTYFVDGLLTEGLTILAGAPKMGKSWMALALALAIPEGKLVFGGVATDQAEVLYAALEDNQRRLQTRLRMLAPTERPTGLYFMTELPRLDEGLGTSLRRWLEEHPKVRLVIIDTLARIRPLSNKSNDYMDDTKTVQELQAIASDLGVSILLVTHTRKTAADDAFDEVLGSRGLTGVADSVLVLRRARNQADAILAVTGRDVEEREVAFGFKKGHWTMLGLASQADVTAERAKFLNAIRDHSPQGIGPKDLASALGADENAVKQMLRRAADDGQITKLGRGRYAIEDSEATSALTT